MTNLEKFFAIRDSLPTHEDKIAFTGRFLAVLAGRTDADAWEITLDTTLRYSTEARTA